VAGRAICRPLGINIGIMHPNFKVISPNLLQAAQRQFLAPLAPARSRAALPFLPAGVGRSFGVSQRQNHPCEINLAPWQKLRMCWVDFKTYH